MGRKSKTVLFSAKEATFISDIIPVAEYSRKTFQIDATDVSSGATILIQSSLNGEWATIATASISSNGSTEIAINDFYHLMLRVNISSYSDGTYTCTYVLANQ